MSNPVLVNSTNIKQFGFTVTIDLELRKMLFDISNLTIFNGGGAALCKGVNFEVIDPSGIKISSIDFPLMDINTATAVKTYSLDLPSGIALFGYYKVRGVIRDADNKDYEALLPPKEVCEPDGWDGEKSKGQFSVVVNCETPYIRISETTVLTYGGRDVYRKVNDGRLYYPVGTVSEWTFTNTPVETRRVYTGDYVLRNKTLADYNLDDNFFVRISYSYSEKIPITCRVQVASVMCCIMDVQNNMQRNQGNNKGVMARQLLDSVSIPLLVAVTKERSGLDPSKEIQEIRTLLDCECNCGESEVVESILINGTDVPNYSFKAGGATTVGITDNGTTKEIKYASKVIQVQKKDNTDTAFTLDKTEDVDNVYWKIGFNYKVLATTILNTVKTDSALTTLLNSLITPVAQQVSLTGLNGKCIIDMKVSEYTFSGTYNIATTKVVGVSYNNKNVYSTTEFALNSDGAIADFLNSQNLTGTFSYVSVDRGGGNYQIFSNANGMPVTSVVQALGLKTTTINATGGTDILSFFDPYTPVKKSLVQVLQATLNYLCEITAQQVTIGDNNIEVYSFDQTGAVVKTKYGADFKLQDFISNMAQAMATFASRITALGGADCTSLKSTFKIVNADVAATDALYGLKSGNCAQMNVKEIAIAIAKLAQTDTDVAKEFCKIVCSTTPSGQQIGITGFTINTTV